MSSFTGHEILYLGGGDWDACPRGTDIMRVLARWGNRVVVIESPGMRVPKLHISDLKRAAARANRLFTPPRRPEPGIEVIAPATLPFPSSQIVRTANAVLQLATIRRALHRNRFGPRPQLWLSSPIFTELVPHLDHTMLLYDCFDEWTAFPGMDTGLLERLESHLIAMSDVVTVGSMGLLQNKRPKRRDLVLVPNGVDPKRFEGPESRPPSEMAGLPRPVIGYSGNIYQRLDLDLLAALARARPAWSFVFVGLVRCDLAGLDRLPNVRFLGLKPWADLPCYIRSFDVGIIPHKLDRLTAVQNPTKLYEYLASGLPVVATELPELRAFPDFVRIGEGAEGFAAEIEKALEDRCEEARARRRREAQHHSWEERVRRIADAVETVMHRTVGSRGAR